METMEKTKSLKEVEDVIGKALKKVGARKENDLCRYIPMATGGYMHHFTMKKMKTKQPHELSTMIEKYIINADRPGMVAPKTRAARGSRKRRDQVVFSRGLLDKLLSMARATGDKDLVTMLSPRRPLAICKRELISSIRHNRIEQELWHAYVDALSHTADSK